MEFKLSLTAMK